jgi:predicted transcriptional regulator
MATTIQISEEVKDNLDKMKIYERESYNEILEWMLEDDLELNKKTKREIEEAQKRISSGKFLTQEQVEKKLGF